MTLHSFFLCLLLALCCSFVQTRQALADQTSLGNPVEIGLVRWQRDFPAALTEADRTGKPVFLLFQEVPGCIGCQTFGREVLSHPLLVEAIEDYFIPVLVYNNRSSGMDAELLARFNEPAWNFQVIRFLDREGEDIIPRLDRVWTVSETAERMAATLEKKARPVPHFLANLILEEDSKNIRQIAFAMFCFWTGEYTLGKIDGVVNTEAGFYQESEVTLVSYNEKRVSREVVIGLAAEQNCAKKVYLDPDENLDPHGLATGVWQETHYRAAPADDQKKQLQGSPQLAKLAKLTPMQRTKLNALLPDDRQAAMQFLSPRQKKKLGITDE
ncbi:MAG: thioredoxin family protein [Proteobacteria bacterium]|nr:thioredoxin family protein [Pseudomonadota bacterium]